MTAPVGRAPAAGEGTPGVVDPDPSLLGWLTHPSSLRGVHMATADGGWSTATYAELAAVAGEVAAGLRQRGVRPGDVVALPLSGGHDLVAALFGTMLAGAVPAPVAPPGVFGDAAMVGRHLRGVLAAADPAAIIVAADDVDAVASCADPAHTAGRLVTVADVRRGAARRGTGELRPGLSSEGSLALLQFTSGSSGLVRGVRITRAALQANMAAIGAWLGFGPDASVASWLPAHHDMGLVGCLLAPVCHQMDVQLLQPADFVRSPLRYLRCFGDGATHSAMPAFGLGYLLRRLANVAIEDLPDLSSLRALVLGAERIDPGVLAGAGRLLERAGLQPGTLLPAYGLAEATLAVTGARPGQAVRAVDIPAGENRCPSGAGPLGEAGPAAAVGCGTPLQGVEVTIVGHRAGGRDGSGHGTGKHGSGHGAETLGEGAIGEIVVRGPSVASGYWKDGNPLSTTRFVDGCLHTGDAGVMIDGELFVVGRLGDAVKVRGRHVFAEDLQALLTAEGLPAGRTVVTLGGVGGRPTAVVVVVVEGNGAAPGAGPKHGGGPPGRGAGGGATVEVVRRVLRGAVPDVDVEVHQMDRGAVARTTSGKPKRRQLWEQVMGR